MGRAYPEALAKEATARPEVPKRGWSNWQPALFPTSYGVEGRCKLLSGVRVEAPPAVDFGVV